MTKKQKKEREVPSVIEDGIEWVPLSDIHKMLKDKGEAISMNGLIRQSREANIKCSKKLITRVFNNKPIWAIPKADYDYLKNKYSNYFYLIHLYPNGDGDSRLLVKLGYSCNPQGSRSKKYKTLAPENTIIGQWPCAKQFEPLAIKIATARLALKYGSSDELFKLLDEGKLEIMFTVLDRWFNSIMPIMEAKALDPIDFKYNPVKNQYERIEPEALDSKGDEEDEPSKEEENAEEPPTQMALFATSSSGGPSVASVSSDPNQSSIWCPTKFKAWRISKGFSQRELASILGVTGKAISNYEIGKNAPEQSRMQSLLQMMAGFQENPQTTAKAAPVPIPSKPLSWCPAKLKEWRISRNFSQKDVGVKIGVSDKAISNYEKGKNVPGQSYMKSLLQLISEDNS